MRHDPELARLVHPAECRCHRCSPNHAFRALFGWMLGIERPLLLIGFLAAAVALALVPGRYLLALAVAP